MVVTDNSEHDDSIGHNSGLIHIHQSSSGLAINSIMDPVYCLSYTASTLPVFY